MGSGRGDRGRRKKFNHDLLNTLAREIRCVDSDLDGARTYGELRTTLERRGTPLGPYDRMIAAHALALGLVVVTDNEREFRRVKSLPVENWRDRQDRHRPSAEDVSTDYRGGEAPCSREVT